LTNDCRIRDNRAVTTGGSGAGGGVFNEAGAVLNALLGTIVGNTPDNIFP
jgi:hypothetical protein